MKTEKLQKILANQGLGSRRELEHWIDQGRVSVNGQIVKLGERATLKDNIRVDGHLIQFEKNASTRVLVYHKPIGEVSTRFDEAGRPTIFDHLPKLYKGRWISVGRLDISTSGLMLFTNDGELANRLMHPSGQIEREYAVRVLGEVTQEMKNRLRTGVILDDGTAKFERIVDAGGQGANHWYHVTLTEGRNREVRRLWESQDVTVSRLSRVRFGVVHLPSRLPRGRWEELSADNVVILKKSLLPPPR
jgi:23S rRNA pseudouridine2605 synthase